MIDKKVDNPKNQSWVNIDIQKFACHEMWLYGTEGRRKVDEENSDKWTCFFQDEYMPCTKECCVFGASVVLVCKLQLFALPAALKFEIMCQSPFFFRTWWQMKIPLWLTTTHRSSKQTWMGNSKTGKPWSWSPSLRRSVLFFVLSVFVGGMLIFAPNTGSVNNVNVSENLAGMI